MTAGGERIGGSPVSPRQEARSQAGVLRWFEVIRRIDALGCSRLLSRSDRATFAMNLRHCVFLDLIQIEIRRPLTLALSPQSRGEGTGKDH